jgi:hypothetical protein
MEVVDKVLSDLIHVVCLVKEKQRYQSRFGLGAFNIDLSEERAGGILLASGVKAFAF